MRRRIAISLFAAVLVPLVLVSPAAPVQTATAADDPAKWRTWDLEKPNQFPLVPPPRAGSAVTRAELNELLRLQRTRGAAQRAAVRNWNSRPAVVAWTEVALRMIVDHRPRPPFSARALALLETGMYDAMVAAYQARAAYRGKTRPEPSKLEPRLEPLLSSTGGTSYAPPEAAIAGAAEDILAYLFPNEPRSTFRSLASEAVQSRLWAGANYRTDVTRARELGRKIARLVIARGESDGHTSTTIPPPLVGEAYWSPTPPAYEPPIGGPVGGWKPWLLPSPSALRGRIPGPSAYGSPQFTAQLREVLDVSRTLTREQRQIAFFWDDGPGTFTPAGHWFAIAIDLVKSFKLGSPQTARAFAVLGAAEADAAIAFFEAKYQWWSIRPVTAMWRLCDGGLVLCTEAEVTANPARATHRNTWFPLIITPAFPSYPGGHSTFSGAAGRVLTHFFPSAGGTINKLAKEAADSRLYGGIHFDEDNDDGLVLGRGVADLAIRWTQTPRS